MGEALQSLGGTIQGLVPLFHEYFKDEVRRKAVDFATSYMANPGGSAPLGEGVAGPVDPNAKVANIEDVRGRLAKDAPAFLPIFEQQVAEQQRQDYIQSRLPSWQYQIQELSARGVAKEQDFGALLQGILDGNLDPGEFDQQLFSLQVAADKEEAEKKLGADIGAATAAFATSDTAIIGADRMAPWVASPDGTAKIKDMGKGLEKFMAQMRLVASELSPKAQREFWMAMSGPGGAGVAEAIENLFNRAQHPSDPIQRYMGGAGTAPFPASGSSMSPDEFADWQLRGKKEFKPSGKDAVTELPKVVNTGKAADYIELKALESDLRSLQGVPEEVFWDAVGAVFSKHGYHLADSSQFNEVLAILARAKDPRGPVTAQSIGEDVQRSLGAGGTMTGNSDPAALVKLIKEAMAKFNKEQEQKNKREPRTTGEKYPMGAGMPFGR